MKIALACADIRPDERQGGIAMYTFHLARGLTDRGHQVTILGLSFGDITVDDTGPIRFVYIPRIKYWTRHEKLEPIVNKLTRSRALSRYLSMNREFDVIEFPIWDAEGLHATRVPGLKTVVRGHTPHAVVNQLAEDAGFRVSRMDRWASKLELKSARQASLFLASSDSSVQTAEKVFGFDPARIRKCRLGTPISEVVADAARQPVRVIFVGRLENRKGIHEILASIPRVLEQFPDTHFDLAGLDMGTDEGESFESYFARTAPAEISKQVSFYGRISDEALNDLWLNAQIALLPSQYESFGLVHVEAMGYGLPVVACDIVATQEVVEADKTAFLVPVGDSESLAERMIRLIANPKLRLEMGQAGKIKAADFSVDAMAKCVEKAYQSIL